MKRKIIAIDESRCNGCGKCVSGCAEGAIQVVDGKARLVGEQLCDGLGACLGECPQGAISLIEVDAAPPPPLPCGCPGTLARSIARPAVQTGEAVGEVASELRQWPVQLALLNPAAPYFRDADLLVAADCVAFACGDFHRKLLRDRVVVTFCPKLDGKNEEYVAKLAEIFRLNDIRSVTVARMEVPCCGGTLRIVEEALARAGKEIPVKTAVVGIDGTVAQ